MFAGQNDNVVPYQSNRRLMELFVSLDNNPLVDYFEVPDFDHMTFLVGKDMSYFAKVIELVNYYNKFDIKGREREDKKREQEKLTKEERHQKKLDDLIEA